MPLATACINYATKNKSRSSNNSNLTIFFCSFFEWDRSGKQKRPYFIHFRNNAPTAEMDELDEGKNERDDGLCDLGGGVKVDQNVVNGRLLTMAGLFDIATETHEVSEYYTHTPGF